jgi:hypothetical protein
MDFLVDAIRLDDIPHQIIFIFGALLFILLAKRIDAYVKTKIAMYPQFGLAMFLTGSFLLLFLFISFFLTTTPGQPFNIHSQHIQLAKDAQIANNLPQAPGMRGDSTKRFSVNFDHADTIQPNQDTQLTFKITDASNGNPIQFFDEVYEKPMHLIIVDSSLSYFSHIHPTQTLDGFTITTQFPKEGVYHLYIDFQPFGAIEQQFAFILTVGTQTNNVASNHPVDTNMKKIIDGYEITMEKPHPLRAEQVSIGEQKINFTIVDAKTKKPVTTLKPYLAAYGHLVMINEKTYDYIHVHPTNLIAPAPNANGGPTISFLPLGLYGPIKAGTYRVFVQLNPNNHLLTADYTITID